MDKTAFLADLVSQEGGYFFLSRPRRFGKSLLLLSTMEEALLENRGLFQGLYLEDHWDWDTRHPVVHIRFEAGVIRDAANLGERFGSFSGQTLVAGVWR